MPEIRQIRRNRAARGGRPAARRRGLACALAAALGLASWLAADRAGWAPAGPWTALAAPASAAIQDARDVMERVSAALNRIQDIQARVEIIQPGQESSLSRAVVDVKAKLPNLFRVTYIKPDAFTDMFYVIDRDNGQVYAYYPVTDTVVQQKLEKALADRSIPVADPQQLLQLPSPESFDLKLAGTETIERVLHYIVEARPKSSVKRPDSPTVYRFWVDSQRWLISRVEAADERGRPVMKVQLNQIRINQGLAEHDLRRLPPGARIQVQS